MASWVIINGEPLTPECQRLIPASMHGPDRRIQPFRTDLAAEHLRGQVDAARFVSGVAGCIVQGSTALRSAPSSNAPLDSELLYGEGVTVYDEADGWMWLQNETDGYVGYVASAAVGARTLPPTHRLSALRSFIYPEPDLKSPPGDMLSFGARIHAVEERGAYCQLDGGGWVYSRHLSPIDVFEPDHVSAALRFLGTPYLWGGRTSIGLDCSALTQLSLASRGLAAPRDSDLQAAQIGTAIEYGGEDLEYGDLIFWPGHCGIWIDSGRFLHANATDMAVSLAPLVQVADHIADVEGVSIAAVRRP